MYFEKFPKVVHTLDNYKTGQVIPDILRRTKFVSQLTTNFAFYDEYDVQDGETPEIVADKFYNNPQLHWIILQTNEILDPRFDWPLSSRNLYDYTLAKYGNVNAVHHYEDDNGYTVNGNVVINSAGEFTSLEVGNVVVNVTNTGTGFITNKSNASSISITVTSGGFQAGDTVALSTNSLLTSNITSTTILNGTPVTNSIYEDGVNEQKRRISILKPEIISQVISDFESLITK